MEEKVGTHQVRRTRQSAVADMFMRLSKKFKWDTRLFLSKSSNLDPWTVQNQSKMGSKGIDIKTNV